MLIVYAVAIFAGAFLLFLVQPMFARMILPLYGGVPAVWNTAMVFYQVALLCGYAYTHAMTSWLSVMRQAIVHISLMILALLALPIAVPQGWVPPTDVHPTLSLLMLLFRTIGLPFFVISATSPLLQKWFSRAGHPHSADPYFLYAAGNLGSMLALFVYPVVAEPLLTLPEQSRTWTLGYCAAVLLIMICAILLRKSSTGERTSELAQLIEIDSGVGQKIRWMALAAVPSSLMLSVTTYITTDIAAVPLLWVIPLAVYLLSFILVFSRKWHLSHDLMVKAMPIMLLPLVIVLSVGGSKPLIPVMTLHLLVLFLIAMVCHGELVRSRPPAVRLTEFYLYMSLGGALGGTFNSLVAPLMFNSIAEYPIALTIACLLMPRRSESSGLWVRTLDILLAALTGLLCIALDVAINGLNIQAGTLSKTILFGLPILVAFSFSCRPLRLGLTVGAIFLSVAYRSGGQHDVLFTKRSFFGVNKIERNGPYIQFMHGTTMHGRQWIDPARHREPVAYYHRTSPLGQLFTSLEASRVPRSIGIVGLGSGGIACYARPEQQWTYFEIDPVVVQIAQNRRLFTYLSDCPASLKVVLGDGRASLTAWPDHDFDILILDAYSSDSVPVHLLTREAVQLYLRKVTASGIIIFNISNRYLDLEPVLGNLAKEAGLACITQEDLNVSSEEGKQGKTGSKYMILAGTDENLKPFAADARWVLPATRSTVGVWTDDYSSIFRILKWYR